jgi:hypothetical protein
MSGSKLTVTGLSTNPPPNFESAVSLNNAGTVLAVGAPSDRTIVDADTFYNGKLVIFRLNGSTWTEEADFQAGVLAPVDFGSELSSLSFFAVSLNAEGDLAIVGASCKWKKRSVLNVQQDYSVMFTQIFFLFLPFPFPKYITHDPNTSHTKIHLF